MAALSISSQVAQGHVGNSATAFALRRLGVAVWEIPTIVLSHHPGHGRPAGYRTPAPTVAAMLDSVLSRGRPDCLLSGYLADPANAGTICERLSALRRVGTMPYILDPVMGDSHTGLYVDQAVAEAMAEILLPLATVILPNRFELAQLSGMPVDETAECVAAARALLGRGPEIVICTSAPAGPGRVAALTVTPKAVRRVEMAAVAQAPHGVGDLFFGLFAAKWMQGAPPEKAMRHAAGAVHAVITHSHAPDAQESGGQESGGHELLLTEAQAGLDNPPQLPEITPL